jgi:hypothetical protein
MHMAIRMFTAAAGALLLSTAAFADVTAVYHADGKESSGFAVKGNLVRWTFSDPRGQQVMVFDNKRKVMTVIDHSRKQVVEMNETSIKAMQEQMKAMMAQMQEQLKNLPPQQRKMIEQRMGATSPTKTKVVAKKGKADKIKGYPCRYYDMVVNGKPEQQVCVAKAGDVGVPAKDYKTLEGMFEFMRKMAKSYGGGSAPLAQDVRGIPVRMKEYRTGRIQTVNRMSDGSLQDSLFKIPAYKRVDPFAPRRR